MARQVEARIEGFDLAAQHGRVCLVLHTDHVPIGAGADDDRLGLRGSGVIFQLGHFEFTLGGGDLLRRLQPGYARSYAQMVVLGGVLILTYLVWTR